MHGTGGLANSAVSSARRHFRWSWQSLAPQYHTRWPFLAV